MKFPVIALVFSLIFAGLATIKAPAFSVAEPQLQAATPQAPPTAASPSAQSVLEQAQAAKANADAANQQANNTVNNANNAVNTVNLLLNFIQAASLFGGVLASVFAILGARIGSRTLNDYREELKKAQADLETMHSGLDRETEQVRLQADRAIRALALMQLGEQQLARHNVRGALQMYEQAHKLDPDNGAVSYFLGELYIQDKQLDKGIDYLQRSITTDPDYAPAEAALGFALRIKADRIANPNEQAIEYAKSEERLLRALKIDSAALDINGEPIWASLGALYKRQGRVDQAITAYEQAHQIAPSHTYPIVNLAILYYRQGKPDKALPYFEQVLSMSSRTLESNPQDYWARLDRLTAALALGKPDSVKQDLDIVLQQVTIAAPLETAVKELSHLRNAPQPLLEAEPVIVKMNDAIANLKGT